MAHGYELIPSRFDEAELHPFSRHGQIQALGSDDPDDDRGEEGEGESRQGPQMIGETINAIGEGRFQWLAALLLGFGNAADAVELTSVSFILPQWHLISSVEKGVVSAAVFLGMLVGSIFSGMLSDRVGRKLTIVSCLFLNALFGLCSAFSPGWPWFVAFRTLSGVGVGGSAGLVFTLLAEFLPVAGRGFYLTVVAWFWMIGSIYAAGTAWIMLGAFDVSWRWYAVVSMLPAATGALLMLVWVPESPRWLLLQGRYAEAVDILRHIAVINRRTDEFEASSFFFEKPSSFTHNNIHNTHNNNNNSTVRRWMRGAWAAIKSMGKLFRPAVLRTTLLLAVVFWALSYGWYGLTMWIPTILSELDLKINAYESSFFVTAATLPGNIISALLVDRIGRKHLLCWSMLLAGVSAIGFAFAQQVNSTAYTIVIAMLFNCLGTMGWNALDCISAELFPTEIRNSGLGFVMAFGRLGSLVSQLANGALLQVSLAAMLSIIAVNVLGGCAAAFFLAEPAGSQLEDKLS